MRKVSDYYYSFSEPGMNVGIYLPKKLGYQEKLFTTLKNGFELDFRRHYKGEKEEEIKSLLEDYDVFIDKYDRYVNDAYQIMFGYSMYEVDGVFYNRDNRDIVEERTQIVNIIFLPDYGRIQRKILQKFDVDLNIEEIKNISHNFLSIGRLDKKVYNGIYKNITQEESKILCEEYIINYLNHWTDYVGFFLFGYIVYELTIGVNSIEKELLVTSNCNFSVNRIRKRKRVPKEIFEVARNGLGRKL